LINLYRHVENKIYYVQAGEADPRDRVQRRICCWLYNIWHIGIKTLFQAQSRKRRTRLQVN